MLTPYLLFLLAQPPPSLPPPASAPRRNFFLVVFACDKDQTILVMVNDDTAFRARERNGKNQ